MKNKLFLICPAAGLEPFIREKYGKDVLFLTALGGVFDFTKIDYLEAIAGFINREAITEIFVVNDTSCPFMESVLEKKEGYGTEAEQAFLHLLIDNYSHIMQKPTKTDKKKSLARLNVQQQALEILMNELFLQQIAGAEIALKGLVTSKKENKLMEVNVRLKEVYR